MDDIIREESSISSSSPAITYANWNYPEYFSSCTSIAKNHGVFWLECIFLVFCCDVSSDVRRTIDFAGCETLLEVNFHEINYLF